MSTSKLTIGIAGILGVAGMLSLLMIGTGVYERRMARQTEAALAIATQEYDVLQKHLEELQSQAHSADQARAALQKSVDDLRQAAAAPSQRPAAPPAQPPSFPARGPARDPKADGQAFLAAFPEQRTSLIDIGKAQISRSFGPFYRAAGLSPSQVDQFESLMSESWLQNIVVAPNGIHPDASQLPEDKIHALLGDQAYQQYQEYNRTQPAHSLALQLATAATNSNAPPLSPEQADQMAQIVLNNNPSYQSGGPLRPDATDWDAVLKQAKGVLSAPQLQVAEGMLLNMQYRAAMNQALRAPVSK